MFIGFGRRVHGYSVDEGNFGLAQEARTRAIYIVPISPLTQRTSPGGPIAEKDALRAVRVANIDLSWPVDSSGWTERQTGRDAFFTTSEVPIRDEALVPIEESWLPPSVTRYDRAMTACVLANGDEKRIVPRRIAWDELPPAYSRSDLTALVAQCEREPACVGVLKAEWNAHPAGSVIVAESSELDDVFWVVDLPNIDTP